MARILPPLTDGFIFRSHAERDVYEYLLKNAPEDWTVLHSVWLATSDKKEHAEIDFLVITGEAILCLEIKGGEVWRDENGTWHFQTKDGKRHNEKNEGPFDQAKEAYYAARNALRRFGREDLFFNRAWGYGVLTTDCALDFRKGDGWLSREMLIDTRDFPDKTLECINKMAAFWASQSRKHKQNHGRSESDVLEVSERDHLEFVQIFRPSIQVINGPSIQALQSIRAADTLTQQQFSILKSARSLPRIMLSGLAGTGKTIVARECARRAAQQGKVLFTCFNKNLAEHLVQSCDSAEWDNVTFLNYHQLVFGILKSAGMAVHLSEDWGAFNQAAEGNVLSAVAELGDEFEPYDYLIVDEAQDLMSPEFFSVLDFLLKGGIDEGKWTLCFDPAQVIYNSQFDEAVKERLQKIGTQLHLDENCRNTKQIAAYVSGISKVMPESLVAVSGPQVDIDYFEDFSEYGRLLRRHLNNLIADFRDVSIPSSEIVILTFVNGAIEELDGATRGKLLLPVVHYSQRSQKEEITWSSVHAFKGLEAVAIIVIVSGDLSDEDQRRLFYVAGSRARARLVILAPLVAEPAITNSLPSVLQLIAGT